MAFKYYILTDFAMQKNVFFLLSVLFLLHFFFVKLVCLLKKIYYKVYLIM